MNTVMVTLRLDPDESDFSSVKDRLALRDAEVDSDFGLVEISPRRHLYTMLVDPRAAARVRSHEGVMRVSSNPEVAAVGRASRKTSKGRRGG